MDEGGIVQLLPDGLANQIAAGEVVQRPASVVKELLENSIDAGASVIVLQVEQGGKQQILVQDDGCGLSWGDARLCFERHATSKIRSVHDLERIGTMGFRGEALASIASVAEVTLECRRKEDDVGSRVQVAGAKFIGHWPATCAVGARFMVRNLFFNVPARRRFLKSTSVEMRHVMEEFQRVALAHPEVKMELFQDQAPVYRLLQGNVLQRIMGLFGDRFERDTLPLNATGDEVEIKGYIGKPSAARKRVQEQFFFVNGRFMRSPYFHNAVISAYTHLIDSDRVPPYFIYFTLPAHKIDVNIHPSKTEVKFEDERYLWQVLNAAVRNSLGRNLGANHLDFDNALNNLEYVSSESTFSVPTMEFSLDYDPFAQDDEFSEVSPSTPIEHEEPPTHMPVEAPASPPQERVITLPSRSLDPPSQQGLFKENPEGEGVNLQTIQVFDSYLITPLRSGLVLIDQHRAHFRILYDAFTERSMPWEAGSVPVLYTHAIALPPEGVPGIEELIQALSEVGIVLELSGDNQLVLKGVPVGLSSINQKQLLEDIVALHMAHEHDVTTYLTDTWRAEWAERNALRRGEPLSEQEQQQLLLQLFSSRSPEADPYERPILVRLPEAMLRNLIDRV